MKILPPGFKVDGKTLVSDLTAGGIFAVINVPLAMGSAVVAGVNPAAGLFTLMVATPIGALFTSSVFMNVATTSALSVAVGEAILAFQGGQKYQALLVLVMLVGVFQILFGLLKFGRLTRFIANSVMTGFTAGVAMLIVLRSVSDVTGFQSTQPFHFLRLAETALNWRVLDFHTVSIGIGTILLILGLRPTALRKFSLLLALMAATAATVAMHWSLPGGDVVLVGDIAAIPYTLPYPVLPELSLIPSLVLPAFAIAVIGSIQSAAVGQNFPNPDGAFPDTSRDFAGLGVANLVASTFGAIPSGASMGGTAVNIQAGARSRWCNISAGAFVVLIVFMFADVVKLIPMAALGGLMIVVGFQNLQPDIIRTVWTSGMGSRIGMAVTFVATLTIPLHFAILLGVVVSFVLQILQMANQVKVREIELVEGGFPIERQGPFTLGPGEIRVIRIRGSLFFASAQALEAQLPKADGARGTTLILSLSDIDDLGSTLIRFLQGYSDAFRRAGGVLVLSGVSDALYDQFERTRLLGRIGRANVFRQRPEIGASLNDAVLAARARQEHQASPPPQQQQRPI